MHSSSLDDIFDMRELSAILKKKMESHFVGVSKLMQINNEIWFVRTFLA